MTQLMKLCCTLSLMLFVSGCSTYYTEPEAAPATVKTKTKVKITRGTGYGEEVPYDSRYGSAN